MVKFNYQKYLACPNCKTKIIVKKTKITCGLCKKTYHKVSGFWNFIDRPSKHTQVSLNDYDKIYKNVYGGPKDGSYNILGSMARGNRTIDIACGEGLIAKFAKETVGIDFSLNALKKARLKGLKNLILADAHAIPFQTNTFDLAISSGNLEHFDNPYLALSEMARVSKIQVLIVHRYPPVPFASLLYKLFTWIFSITHQPIEKPIDLNTLEKMLAKIKLKIIYKGVWTLPLNYGRVIKFLPEFKNTPSCSFIISIKNG